MGVPALTVGSMSERPDSGPARDRAWCLHFQ
jgi:hypothetical protein